VTLRMALQTSLALRLVHKNTFLVAEPDDKPDPNMAVCRCSSSPCLFGYLDSDAESTACGDSEMDESVQESFPNTDDEFQEPVRRAEKESSAGKRRGFPLRHHCHFPVGIEQDERFNVVKRLLGAEAENTRSITRANHGSKIQIKGRGASLRETSDEPLVICVSTPSKPKLERVAVAVEALVRSVHEQYHAFGQEEGLPAASLRVVCLPGFPEML